MKTRKNILMILGLVLLLGGSYAFYTYQKYSGMQNLLNGEIYLNYLEDNEVHISGIFPETKEEALKRDDNTINFKVLSKNTSDKDIYYGITLNYGEEISNKIRIDSKYIMIYLECDGKVLIDGIRYSDFNNRRIYVDKIDAKTYTETTKNYTLRFWVDEETSISDTDANASYKATEWANSYLNFKVNVDAGLETMNMPLSMETSDTYVENNKAYFIAKISNFINMEDLGKDSNDTMNLKITGTNSDIKFSYKDSEGNTVEEKSATLDLTYLFTKNKTVEIQVFVHPNNDANGKTNVLLEIYKNKELMQSFIKRVEVKGNNYCLNNGFNKLVDCMLVSDSLSESVDVAKTNILNKGTPNLTDTAPSYIYVEKIKSFDDLNKVFNISSTNLIISSSYEFDSKTGLFKLVNSIKSDIDESVLDYYTCGNNYEKLNCNILIKIKSINVDKKNNIYQLTDGDYHYAEVSSYIRSEVGLYKTEDDYGDVYYYRGDVQNNNVYFAGFYWKIIRTNGDGSIRLQYSEKTPINNQYYSFNNNFMDPTYVGYMYGKNFDSHVNEATAFYNISFFTNYLFATNYEFDETTKKFNLSGDTFNGLLSEAKGRIDNYKYTCFSNESVCDVVYKLNIINDDFVTVNFISYSSISYEDTLTNQYDSNAKTVIDKWYETNIISKIDSNNQSITNYISDATFCNDRSIHTGNGWSLSPGTNYSAMNRIIDNGGKTVSLKCLNVSDRFSVTEKYGNAKLKYPVALVTADEIIFAGGVNYLANRNNYLFNGGYSQWTMTPIYYTSSHNEARNGYMLGNGAFYIAGTVNNKNGLYPVINIRSDVLISSGDGTVDNPYQLMLK